MNPPFPGTQQTASLDRAKHEGHPWKTGDVHRKKTKKKRRQKFSLAGADADPAPQDLAQPHYPSSRPVPLRQGLLHEA